MDFANIVSGNGTESLPGTILACHHLDPKEYISMKFDSKYKIKSPKKMHLKLSF